MKQTDIHVNTAWYQSTVTTTLDILKKVLGEPQWADNDGCDKSNFDWEMETEDGTPFTVYDWKEYRPIEDDELIEWHIGGINTFDTEKAKEEIVKAIDNLK